MTDYREEMAAPSFSDEPESNQSGAQRLPYALKGFESPGLGVRHVISHRESGLPPLAAEIREATGVPFHWHLARHSFFNRAYAAIAAIEDREERQIKLNDLIYWGGWADPNSINIYVRAARKERARKNLMRWQEQGSPWTALD